jgi:hypothetical protein
MSGYKPIRYETRPAKCEDIRRAVDHTLFVPLDDMFAYTDDRKELVELVNALRAVVTENHNGLAANANSHPDVSATMSCGLACDLAYWGVEPSIIYNMPMFYQTFAETDVCDLTHEHIEQEGFASDCALLFATRKTEKPKLKKLHEAERQRLKESILAKGKRVIARTYAAVNHVDPFAQYYRELRALAVPDGERTETGRAAVRAHALALIERARSLMPAPAAAAAAVVL